MDYYSEKAEAYLNELCVEIPDRSVGSEGNRRATNYFRQIMDSFNLKTTSLEFECMDWVYQDTCVTVDGEIFPVKACPYSLPVNVKSELACVSSADELAKNDYSGKVLLMQGDIVKEQLIPRGFKFYNPPEHQKLHNLLEKSGVKAIISATSRNPTLAGGIYPFPFTEDGDFNIPSLYMKDTDGINLAKKERKEISVVVKSERKNAKGYNVQANIGKPSGKKIIICAHIDSKLGTPGAIDNASGVVVLMLLAEQLINYNGKFDVEIVALNGEDYFSTPGQIAYLEKLKEENADIELVINMDGAGYKSEKSAISTYSCSAKKEKEICDSFLASPGIVRGEDWVQSDHSMFAMQGIPSMAITSANMIEKLCYDITHTEKDVPSIIDCGKLSEIAEAINSYIRGRN